MIKGYSFSRMRAVTDSEKINENILNVFRTEYGSRPNLPTFGSKLYLLQFCPLDLITQDLAKIYITEAIKVSEPRVTLQSINTSVSGTVLNIEVEYIIDITGEPGTLKYFIDVEGQ